MRSRRNISRASDLSPSPAVLITPVDYASTGRPFAGIAGTVLTRACRKASGLSPLAGEQTIRALFALTGAPFAGATMIGTDKHRRRRTSGLHPSAAATGTPARFAMTGALSAGDATTRAKRRRRKASGSNQSAAPLNTPARSAPMAAQSAGGKPSGDPAGGLRRESFSPLEISLSSRLREKVLRGCLVGSRFRGNPHPGTDREHR